MGSMDSSVALSLLQLDLEELLCNLRPKVLQYPFRYLCDLFVEASFNAYVVGISVYFSMVSEMIE